MKNTTEFLYYMKSYPLWDEFEKFLVEHRPDIPEYNLSDDNTHAWKYNSAKREGFDLVLKLLKIEVEK